MRLFTSTLQFPATTATDLLNIRFPLLFQATKCICHCLVYEMDRKSLWEKSLDLLRSPVQKRVKISVRQDILSLLLAGESALSHHSMLSRPAQPML